MKHFILPGILSFSCIFAHAQQLSFPMKAGKVHYEIVDSSLKNFTQEQLYGMSKLWLFDQFAAVDSLIQLDVPEAGMIAGRMTMFDPIRFKSHVFFCQFSFSIISKDGRYKAQLYDFRLTGLPLEEILANPEKYQDTKKGLQTLEANAYGFFRSIKHAMESIYNVMDF